MSKNDEATRTILPVAREELRVEVREVEGPGVRIKKRVHEREEAVEVPLEATALDVKRVPVGRVVEAREGARREGETTIIPVYEEVAVVERRLVLKEELHITRRHSTRVHRQEVTLREEEAIIEHTSPPKHRESS
ncbi:DUF2382 domain-containing protein [Bradymonadaceae bacterium TMQ3]|uniref:DUF2382 domain-containing protein n=1 Tax=Lujinxingia sediminis TaxID=2480984 RepID=A0ABY0CN26_9DELT|nr:YsnF/AvaK domain-containing protein [Lujinxingia sediminis]RDV36287.1 DUF2382 domain-containing protein [Bradymonadaceae bacterium TMQ3]RVU41071.1 DUF2382 domain-containing protein [Lujinxingia sediminis]TXC67875.1 DUF2382 domain-containing protein [Bradymonadales bacterium TMQ1]